ncbi:MAG: MaoC family dehydratase [Gammaproteobacteria bacterium]
MPLATFKTPATDRYFEDYEVGATYELGQFRLSEPDIVEFALRYDPQPFHLDRAAAARSHFGGIVASGWHTAAAMMRVVVEHFVSKVAGMGSPGLDELRWLKPVRPDEDLTVRVTVDDARRSRTKPDRGLIHTTMEVVGPDGDTRMRVRSVGMVAVRAVTGAIPVHRGEDA